MPKEISHWLIAGEVINRIEDSPLKSAVMSNPDLYYIAAVLPDTPYYYPGGKGSVLRKATADLHHGLNSFLPILEILKKPALLPFDAELTFISGIISHIITDATFHPLIFFFSGEEKGPDSKKSTARHRQIETSIDLFFLSQYPSPKGLTLKQYLDGSHTSRDTISRLLDALCNRNDDTDPGLYKRALWYHAFYQSLFFKSAPKRMLILSNRIFPHRLDHLLPLFYPRPKEKKGYFGAKTMAYRHPVTGEAKTQSLDDLKKEAVRNTLEIFRLWADAGDRKELLHTMASMSGPGMLTGMQADIPLEMKHFSEKIDQ